MSSATTAAADNINNDDDNNDDDINDDDINDDDDNDDDDDSRRVTVIITKDDIEDVGQQQQEFAATSPSSSLAHRSTTSMIHTTTTIIKYPQWHNIISGGVAGACARLLIAPLDLVRIRAQLERRDIYPRPSILSRLKHVYKVEGGIKALFRGNLAASYLWIGYTTVQFSVYGTIKETLEDIREEKEEDFLMQQQQQQQVQSRRQQLTNLLVNPTIVAFISGAGAGVCATIATYPFDITRTVFAARGAVTQKASTTTTTPSFSSSFRPPSSIAESAKSMYQKRGIKGFYAGAIPALISIVPYMGLNFAIYDFLITKGEENNNSKSKSIGLSGYAGSISGAVSKIIVYPLDTVKKRIQIQSVYGSTASGTGVGLHYNGMWDCLATTIRTEGIQGLYRGLFPSVLKTTLGSGLTFTFFRTTKNLLENIHDC
jgi:solute carrier family 25 thiamine pyrophosphate transporter 19